MQDRLDSARSTDQLLATDARGAAGGGAITASGLALILFSTLVTSSQGIAVKFALMGFSPALLMAVRSVLAALLLLALVRLMRVSYPDSPRQILIASGLGVINVVVPGLMYWWALQYTPVGRATLLTSTQPFLMVLMAHFLMKGDRFTSRTLFGLLFGFAGVLLVVVGRGGTMESGGLLVDLSVLTAASMWAVSQIVVKKIGHRWHSLALVSTQMCAAAVLAPLVFPFLEPNWHFTASVESLGGLLYLITMGTVGMFVLMYYILSRYNVSTVSSFIFLQPVFAVFLGWLLLGEALTWTLLGGLLLVMAGLILVNSRRTAAPPQRNTA